MDFFLNTLQIHCGLSVSTSATRTENTPRQKRTQLEASHLPAHSQRGTQAEEDKNATRLRRRQKQQTHQRMFISTSNTDYTIPRGRTASSWAQSLDPPALGTSTLSSTQSPLHFSALSTSTFSE